MGTHFSCRDEQGLVLRSNSYRAAHEFWSKVELSASTEATTPRGSKLSKDDTSPPTSSGSTPTRHLSNETHPMPRIHKATEPLVPPAIPEEPVLEEVPLVSSSTSSKSKPKLRKAKSVRVAEEELKVQRFVPKPLTLS